MNSQPAFVRSIAVAAPEALEQEHLRRIAWLCVLTAAAAMLLTGRSWAEEGGGGGDKKAARAYDEALKQKRTLTAAQQAVDGAASLEAKSAAKKDLAEMKAKQAAKQDMADFKQATLENLGSIKELFAKAEDAWKNKRVKEAGDLYSSVSLASVLGSEQMVETSRGRIIELEDMAKDHLKNADDADLKRDYVKEVEELTFVVRELRRTKTSDVALRRLGALKSHPEVAGHVEIAQAEALEGEGKLTEAVAIYTNVSLNPRYDNSIPSLKAKRKLDELNKNDATRERLKSELDAKAEKEAPVLLNSAKNYVANSMPKLAIEKLQQVVDKFPGTKYAEEAKKQIAGLK